MITPRTNPNHHTVGHSFKYFGEVYFCDSYDPSIGYRMTNIDNLDDRHNVSERAINRTFHHLYNGCKHPNCRLPEAA